ncbi:Protein YffB [Usitatibacter rugosus]|uniref:Protein YffB n=1 Tax=Usitatibacter rugosus TaxID=2732067 RepID=A0A6M4GSN8_9PROT|nr:arsenate reductase [Usitatibacter rugosus]QJR10340.1 Protein YffB [Usitatibacter rugosus]
MVKVKVYGIPNCETVKKARAWLEVHGVEYDFHDYKKQGVDKGRLEKWVREHGWEAILNRSGMTFRKLDPALTQDLNAKKAVALMVAHPSAIKRPVLVEGSRTLVGFKPEAYQAAFPGKR